MVEAGLARRPLVVETGQVFDTHHVAMLLAAAPARCCRIWPGNWRRPRSPARLRQSAPGHGRRTAQGARQMGISTIASYRNSHLFETIGLDGGDCGGVSSRTPPAIWPGQQDSLKSHRRQQATCEARRGRTTAPCGLDTLRDAGLYRFRQRRRAARHLARPGAPLSRLRQAARRRAITARMTPVTGQRRAANVRDLLSLLHRSHAPGGRSGTGRLRSCAASAPRPCRSASLSPRSASTLAIAMNHLGGRSNTGEGGEDRDIYRFAAAPSPQGQAGGLRPFWRHRGVSGARRRARNQDGAGLQARRRRAAAAR